MDTDTLLILVADSGSTKTDWCAAYAGNRREAFRTAGMNPLLQNDDEMGATLAQLPLSVVPARVYFYGAGCTPLAAGRVAALIRRRFLGAEVRVESDLLGAAQALCGHEEGIACVLGTGSNSCLYDGSAIVRTVPPLGYLLGDEGSGNAIGRMFVRQLLRGELPEALRGEFLDALQLTPEALLHKLYAEPMPNRYLASMVPFIAQHRTEAVVQHLLADAFRPFFRLLADKYPHHCPVHFTGSVSRLFRDEVTAAAVAAGFAVGRFVPNPIDNMVTYIQTCNTL